MPIYEYECAECGHLLETIQKMSEDPLKDCPSCNRPALKRLLSAAGFQLKGTGWYATDFKNSGQKKTDSKKTETSKTETSSDSSPSTPAPEKKACGTGGCGHGH